MQSKIPLLVLLAIFVLPASMSLQGCDAAEEAVDDFVEDQLGCKDTQLEGVDEPDLPDCSRVAACCRFIAGRCGNVAFTPNEDVKTACEINDALMVDVIATYRAIDGEQCPDVLVDNACQGGVDQTKAKFVATINDGVRTSAADGAPSCKRIAKETIGKLAATIGGNAQYLPTACEASIIDKQPAEGEGEGEAPDAGGEGEGEGEGEG